MYEGRDKFSNNNIGATVFILFSDIKAMISEKGFYGLTAGVFTTSALQPFETIKMALMLPPADLKLTHNFAKNIALASGYIAKVNGFQGLYKGLFAAATKAGLGSYIYFTILRKLQKQNQTHFQDFILSSFARIASTFFTNALSIIQTRWQMANFHRYKTITGAVIDIYQKQGVKAFFSGALTSCLKEGFFGGLYYMFYQQLKDQGFHKFPAGVISGMISTTITHPLQLIRARLQTLGIQKNCIQKDKSLINQIKSLSKTGEWFKGLTPRLIKKPVANTLTFVIFEIIEQSKANGKLTL